jgi:hypothetical protein
MSTLFPVAASDVALTSNEWYTPPWLFQAAGITFDMDVCAPVQPEYRTCPARCYLTVLEDGLTAPWAGLVWMNPPYTNLTGWGQRWASHPDGLALVPSTRSPGVAAVTGSADAIVLLGNGLEFTRPGMRDGGHLQWTCILAARGRLAVQGAGRVAQRFGTCLWVAGES